jgi:hypothetical protein
MNISDEQIKEFQRLYKKRFGKDISKVEAYEKGLKLSQLLKVVYSPPTTKDK